MYLYIPQYLPQTQLNNSSRSKKKIWIIEFRLNKTLLNYVHYLWAQYFFILSLGIQDYKNCYKNVPTQIWPYKNQYNTVWLQIKVLKIEKYRNIPGVVDDSGSQRHLSIYLLQLLFYLLCDNNSDVVNHILFSSYLYV